MGMRVRAAGAVVAVGVGLLAGCGLFGDEDSAEVVREPSGGEVGDPPAGDVPTSDAPYVELDDEALELPEAPVIGEVALPEGAFPTDVDTVVVHGVDPWVYRVDAFAQRKLLEQLDGTTGEVLRTIELPVLVGFTDLAALDGEVLWLPVRHDEGDGRSSFGVMRIDLAAATFAEVEMPGYVTSVDVAVGTAWATVPLGDTVEVHDLSFAEGDPAPTVRDAIGEDDGQITVPAADGIYDCSFGTWGFTPLGTDERTTVDLETSGCNAVAFDGGLAATSDAPIAILREGSVEREVAVDVEGGVSMCDGPDQPEVAEPVVVCTVEPYENNGVVVARIGTGAEAEILGDLGVDPRRGLGLLGVADGWSDGGVIAVAQQPDLDAMGGGVTYLLTVTGDEVTAARGGSDVATVAQLNTEGVWLIDGTDPLRPSIGHAP